ncbi:MAG: hypothetical protein HKN12_10645 [Gemmatimonadetes bacterium]|nr:hypothetical protein [Gemmatimonadota bacterium]
MTSPDDKSKGRPDAGNGADAGNGPDPVAPQDGPVSREEMVSEFGEPGVANPNIIDLIRANDERKDVTLVMVETRRWSGMLQLKQIEEKINRYMGFALDGFLLKQFPQYDGYTVSIRLDCAEEPIGEAADFLEAARRAMEGEGLRFSVKVGLEQ